MKGHLDNNSTVKGTSRNNKDSSVANLDDISLVDNFENENFILLPSDNNESAPSSSEGEIQMNNQDVDNPEVPLENLEQMNNQDEDNPEAPLENFESFGFSPAPADDEAPLQRSSRI